MDREMEASEGEILAHMYNLRSSKQPLHCKCITCGSLARSISLQ
jgi:hypothetical protein